MPTESKPNGTLLLAALIGAMGSLLAAQESAPTQAPPPISIQDQKKVQDNFLKFSSAWRQDEPTPKERAAQDKALTDMTAEIDRLEKDKRPGLALADTKTWVAWMQTAYTERIKNGKEKAPSGKGTIKDDAFEQNLRGDIVKFEYSYSLPSNYTADKAWMSCW